MKKLCAFLVAVVALSRAVPANADDVSYWNDVTGQAIAKAVPARPGPTGLLDFAAVHLAIHDAVQAFEHRFEPYAGEIPNASGSHVQLWRRLPATC